MTINEAVSIMEEQAAYHEKRAQACKIAAEWIRTGGKVTTGANGEVKTKPVRGKRDLPSAASTLGMGSYY